MTTSPLLPLTAADLPPLAPELVLIGSAFALMILDLFISKQNKIWTHLFSVAALAVVLLSPVLHLLLQGKPAKLIGRQLNLSLSTVKAHTSAVLRALNVTTRTQAVLAASRLGLRFDEPQPAQAPSGDGSDSCMASSSR